MLHVKASLFQKERKSMKAIYMRAPKDLKFEEVPEPVLHDDEVLIKVMAVGVCGSDIPRMLVFGAHVSLLSPDMNLPARSLKSVKT